MPDIPEHGDPGSPAADMEAFVAESIYRVFPDTNTNHIPIGDWKIAPTKASISAAGELGSPCSGIPGICESRSILLSSLRVSFALSRR